MEDLAIMKNNNPRRARFKVAQADLVKLNSTEKPRIIRQLRTLKVMTNRKKAGEPVPFDIGAATNEELFGLSVALKALAGVDHYQAIAVGHGHRKSWRA